MSIQPDIDTGPLALHSPSEVLLFSIQMALMPSLSHTLASATADICRASGRGNETDLWCDGRHPDEAEICLPALHAPVTANPALAQPTFRRLRRDRHSCSRHHPACALFCSLDLSELVIRTAGCLLLLLSQRTRFNLIPSRASPEDVGFLND